MGRYVVKRTLATATLALGLVFGAMSISEPVQAGVSIGYGYHGLHFSYGHKHRNHYYGYRNNRRHYKNYQRNYRDNRYYGRHNRYKYGYRNRGYRY